MAVSNLRSGAAAIYDAVGRIFGWQQQPQDRAGLFFGLPGCTRDALEYAIVVMRDSFAVWSVETSAPARNSVFYTMARQVSEQTGADLAGVKKFFIRVYVAATKDRDIWAYLSGGDFSAWDNVKKVVSESLEAKAENVAETLEYGLTKETSAGSTLEKIIPVAGVMGVCYLAYKVLK